MDAHQTQAVLTLPIISLCTACSEGRDRPTRIMANGRTLGLTTKADDQKPCWNQAQTRRVNVQCQIRIVKKLNVIGQVIVHRDDRPLTFGPRLWQLPIKVGKTRSHSGEEKAATYSWYTRYLNKKGVNGFSRRTETGTYDDAPARMG
jgi:hypothetical protein